MVSLDGRLRRIEQGRRAHPAQGLYAPEDKPPFDYEGFVAAFEQLFTDTQRAVLEAAYGKEGERDAE
jgi:hypothetical protein